MKLYRIETDWNTGTFYVLAEHPTEAVEKLTKFYKEARYECPPVAQSIHWVAEVGVTGKPAVLVL